MGDGALDFRLAAAAGAGATGANVEEEAKAIGAVESAAAADDDDDDDSRWGGMASMDSSVGPAIELDLCGCRG